MFGLDQLAPDERYTHGAEWLDVVGKLWSEEAPFDHHGTYFQLRDVEAEPKPYGGTRPVIMNAGGSSAGKAFALARADCLFTVMQTIEKGAELVRDLKAEGRALKRDVDVYTSVNIVCRPRRKPRRTSLPTGLPTRTPIGVRSNA